MQISTTAYKIRPIKAEVPAGVYAETAIGISVDEVHRARVADVRYMRKREETRT